MARPGLTTHRKFRRLARALGSQIIARGALELIWDSCYESGEDYVGTADDIETMVGWAGERGALAAALVDAGSPEGQGFIEPLDEGVRTPVRYRVHDLWDHVPQNVARRRRRGDRPLANGRHMATNGQQTAAMRQPMANTPQKKDLCTLDLDLQAENQKPEDQDLDRRTTDSALLSFPVVGRGASFWLLTQAQLDEWATLFPGLDVLAECRHALAWVTANEGRRKTASGMRRFLVGWFTRSVNRGGARSPAERPFSERELQQGRDWYRRVGISLDRSVSAEDHIAGFIRRRLRAQAS